MLEITEIIRRAEQGRTGPFLCRASDGRQYFVKGRAATASGLMREWLGATLAQRFGLPVPPASSFRHGCRNPAPWTVAGRLRQCLIETKCQPPSFTSLWLDSGVLPE